MEKHFHHELEILKNKLLDMASKVLGMVSDSIRALVELNLQKIEQVNSAEHEINRLEMEIDNQCLKLIALYQPVGADLRLINTILKTNNDLERVGDEAVNICERAAALIKEPRLESGDILPQMEELTQQMLKKSIDALAENDLSPKDEIFKNEDILDNLNRKLVRDVVDQIKRRPEITDLALDIIFISHRLERIGDMAVNIMEDVMFLITGKDARHPHDKID